MGIKQFNCEYLPKEDRLVFRINTTDGSDFSFLLTRRVTLFILKTTQQMIQQKLETKHVAPVAKAIGEFESEAAREQADFQHQYEVGSQFPLGQSPILVQDVSCRMIEQDGKAMMSMDFQLANDKTINLQLWGHVLQNMRFLLEKMLHQALWHPSPSEASQAQQPAADTNPGPVH